MPTLSRRTALLSLSVVASFAAMLVAQACGSTAQAAGDTSDPVEGVWENSITLKDCASGATVGTALGSEVYHRGGTLTDTNAAPPSTRGPGFGTWTRNGTSYVARIRNFRFNADGTYAGTTKLTRTFTLSADGQTQTSTNTLQLLDPTGAVVSERCATDTSRRID